MNLDCSGKLCLNGALLNLTTCECDCNKEVHSYYGEFCERKLYASELSKKLYVIAIKKSTVTMKNFANISYTLVNYPKMMSA